MIKDKLMISLVEEQTELYLNNGSQKDKIDVSHRIEKRQKELKKFSHEE
jgi:hypothetical protein